MIVRLCIALIMVLGMAATSLAQTTYKFEWWRTYNGPGSQTDSGFDVRVDANENSFLMGQSVNGNGLDGVAIVKYNQAGTFQWQYRIDKSGGNVVNGYMDIDAAGNIYVAATEAFFNAGDQRDVYLVKINPSGTKVWERRFSAPSHTLDNVRGIAVDGPGNIFVLTESTRIINGISNFNAVVFNYDTAGTQRYNHVLNTVSESDNTVNQNDFAIRLKLDKNNNALVAAYSDVHLTSDTDVMVAKYNQAGNVWVRQRKFEDSNFYRALPSDITADAGGNVIVVGRAQDDSLDDADIFTMKFASDGAFQWQKKSNGEGNDFDDAYAVTTNDAGEIFVAGEASLAAGEGTDAVVIRYASNGDLNDFYFYSGDTQDEAFYDVVVDKSGAIHGVGSIRGDDGERYIGWIRFFPDGTFSSFFWRAPTGTSFGRDIALSNIGDVYIGGDYGFDMILIRNILAGSAMPDSYVAVQGRPLTIAAPGVIANDFFTAGATAVKTTNPAHGTVTLNSNGGFTYTPSSNYVGTDSFKYRLVRLGMNGPEATVTFNVKTLLGSVLVYQDSVPGGANAVGRVFLNAPAAAGGQTVFLTSSNSTYAQVPPQITIPAGASDKTFTITTGTPVSNITITISARIATVTVTDTFVVGPVALESLVITPSNVQSGQNTTGTVSLSGPRGVATTVTISENTSVMSAPTSVIIPAGQKSVNFTISTVVVSETVTRPISATWNGVTKSAQVTLLPSPQLVSLTLNPTTVIGGSQSIGRVTLSANAPNGGVLIQIIEDTSVMSAPSSVLVPAGSNTATFAISTTVVGTTVQRPIFAKLGTTQKGALLTIQAGPRLATLTLNPSTVQSGDSSIGTVTITSAAPAGGLVIQLEASSSVVGVPATVTIPQGQTSITFTVTTVPINFTATRQVIARYGGESKVANITLTPA